MGIKLQWQIALTISCDRKIKIQKSASVFIKNINHGFNNRNSSVTAFSIFQNIWKNKNSKKQSQRWIHAITVLIYSCLTITLLLPYFNTRGGRTHPWPNGTTKGLKIITPTAGRFDKPKVFFQTSHNSNRHWDKAGLALHDSFSLHWNTKRVCPPHWESALWDHFRQTRVL